MRFDFHRYNNVIARVLAMTVFIMLLLCVHHLHAGLTPGKYDVEDLGGHKVGDCTVEWTVDKDKNTTVNIHIKTSQLEKKETAIIDKAGLKYFKRETEDENGKSILEGDREDAQIKIRRNVNGAQSVVGVHAKEFDLSTYEIEMKHSPFYGMKEGEAKSARVFSVDNLGAVKTVRNVSPTGVNTNEGGIITVSQFHPKKHILIEERRGNLVFRRAD